MQVTVERLSPVLVEFQVRVPVDQVKQSVDKAYDDLAKKAQIRGFRKGKAPRRVLAHIFGERVAADVADQLVDNTLQAALQEKNMRPISSPRIEKNKVSVTDDFTYRARFEVTPDIDKVDYEGMEVKRPVYEVTDAMIDAELEKLRHQHATLQAPAEARAAQKGDVVTIDFALEVSGKEVEASAAKDVTAELGSGTLLPAINDAAVGKNVGDQFDVELTFPETHQRPEFRNQPARFHITLKEIKERILPALDDEFAKDLGEFDTLEALRQDVRTKLEKSLKDRSENELAEALVAQLCERNPVPVPPSLVQQQARMQEAELIEQLRRQGQNVRALPNETRQRIVADAELKVRAGLLMAEIAKRSQVQVKDEDIQKAYAELAEQLGKNINKIKAQYQEPRQREVLIAMILEDKVLNLIEAAALVTDEPRPVSG